MEGVTKALFSNAVAANDAEVAEMGVVKVMRPWMLQVIFLDIENDMLKVGTTVFSLADKNGNEMAFSLVMIGVNQAQMFKAWW
ncbi:hypothetical protein J1N35_042679 [Gossypium stocksii]|uniref:Uncharacterized protein n=1 Tax=Gossypium stocksii TaxID=47602 RepID=A0A9D3U5X8_9ROSI|nr:hypothetical protein J1N35_042679 [Gossypium stocksii]